MSVIFAAALAGLLATPHCAAMCGGFATACARPRSGLWAWHGGRLLTYAALGAVAGTFGAVLPGPAWLPAVLSATLLLWFAAALAGLAPQPSSRIPGLARAGAALGRRSGTLSRVLFGAATGLLPCGMVYAALSLSVSAGAPLLGAAALVAFGAATLPGLTILALGVQRFAMRGLWPRRIFAALVLACGLWSVGMRGLHASSHDHATPRTVPSQLPTDSAHRH
jgi:sulfite exporter TauE/SafE